MKKSDLKNMMVVELRNGNRYCKIDNFLMRECGHMNLNSYDEDLLEQKTRNNDFDIVRIFNTKGCTFDTIFTEKKLELIWERYPKVDWENVKKGTIILVRNNEKKAWKKRTFISYVNDEVEYPFITYNIEKDEILTWKYAKLKERYNEKRS